MQKTLLFTAGALLAFVAVAPQSASANEFVNELNCPEGIRLGEWLEAPTIPYSCRAPGDYVEKFLDGTPGMDPYWLENRQRGEARMLPGYIYEPRCDCYILASEPGPYRRQPSPMSRFYRNAMNRGSEAFNTFGNFGRYTNGQFDFDGNRLKSIR